MLCSRPFQFVLAGALCLAPAGFAAAQRLEDDRVEERAAPPVERPNQIAVQDLALRLGMELRTAADESVVVARVFPDSQAAALDIRAGDVLKSIERQPILAQTEVVNIIAADNPEKKVAFAFTRDGRPIALTTAFPDRVVRVEPTDPPAVAVVTPGAAVVRSPDTAVVVPARTARIAFFGLHAVETPQGRVVVTSVVPGSAAALAGVLPDDILLAISDRPVTSYARLASVSSSVAKAAMPGDQVTIEALRDGSDQTFVLILREGDFVAERAPIPVEETVVVAPTERTVVVPERTVVVPSERTVVAEAPRPAVRSTDSPEPDTHPSDLKLGAQSDELIVFCMRVRRLANGSIVVSDVMEGSPAALAGIKPGDALVSIGGEKLDSLNEMGRLIATQEKDAIVPFGVVREDKLGQIQIKMTPCAADERFTGAAQTSTVPANSVEQLAAQMRSLQQQVNEIAQAVQALSAAVGPQAQQPAPAAPASATPPPPPQSAPPAPAQPPM